MLRRRLLLLAAITGAFAAATGCEDGRPYHGLPEPNRRVQNPVITERAAPSTAVVATTPAGEVQG